jgi:hypothetical protein
VCFWHKSKAVTAAEAVLRSWAKAGPATIGAHSADRTIEQVCLAHFMITDRRIGVELAPAHCSGHQIHSKEAVGGKIRAFDGAFAPARADLAAKSGVAPYIVSFLVLFRSILLFANA